ncbi:hypothetical protein [Pseudobacter ginsenosidimutans]|uniref:Outer membrane lipoprotein-sorting protein n=1 Tax=Pseudobacter ginsenosidimutans TaxID=661488 RepID=A0A4Q7N4I5_9BACT|nr:hypothetical protein [Pseudobacter ginsenosidimutans]QEC44440.1 hypothetical protein FSB84_23200 [Pseudobacter ginsenosidimutans]RZS75911.1 hypothetical protein EV199_1787 [Pseudobacter ginsenosidimutans]
MNRSLCFSLLIGVLSSAGLMPLQVSAQVQKITPGFRAALKMREDTLKEYSRQMVMAQEPAERFRYDSLFIRSFVRALQFTNSFYYPFDSVNISKLYAPDSAFRIFTWQAKKDEYVVMQRGAIQMRTPDGKLKLIPLHDQSMFTKNPMDSVRSNENWIGAIYYKIILKEYKGKKYYTLIGFDEFSVGSSKKWMEVLSFENGQPVFGNPAISFEDDEEKRKPQHRFSIEFKKEAKAFFNYDPELDLIIVDHLISETDEPARKNTYVPDGDYEAFKWKNGRWVHVTKFFNQKLKDGQFPTDAKILDDAGKADEQKLEEQSRKNYEKERKKNGGSPTPPSPIKKKP